jgi:hypothetical protein
MDLNFLRTAIIDIKGETPLYGWCDPTATTPGLITLSGAREEISNVQIFIGSDGDGDTTTDYSSNNYVTDGDDLETAIGDLDDALTTITSGLADARDMKRRVLIRTGGQVIEDTTIDIETPGAGWTAYGDTLDIGDGDIFVEDVNVYTNGILQLTGVDSSANNDVYFVASGTDVAFEYKIKQNDVLQFVKFPPAIG